MQHAIEDLRAASRTLQVVAHDAGHLAQRLYAIKDVIAGNAKCLQALLEHEFPGLRLEVREPLGNCTALHDGLGRLNLQHCLEYIAASPADPPQPEYDVLVHVPNMHPQGKRFDLIVEAVPTAGRWAWMTHAFSHYGTLQEWQRKVPVDMVSAEVFGKSLREIGQQTGTIIGAACGEDYTPLEENEG